MSFEMFKFLKTLDLNSYTLIVPSVSIGNVGQFAADLLITTLQMEKIASVWDPAITPIVGCDPYNLNSSEMMISCELYANVSKKLAVLQLRSPLMKKYAKEFLTNLATNVKKFGLTKIVILASSFAFEKHNINTGAFRYLCNNFLNDQHVFKDLKWLNYTTEQENNPVIIHGGGFAKKFYDICTELEIPCLILFKYCSEGDNMPDAMEMMDYLNGWMLFSDTNQPYIQPPSWKLFYGNPPPANIF